MKIALVGNQNSGKSTLFNQLTGMNQKIGNWPGVTLEQKTGIIIGTQHEIIDLPGIYSLSSYSLEEKISKDFLLKNKIDLIINVVDVTSIERGLYLTTQLMDLDIKVIVALNMVDRLKQHGMTLNTQKLRNMLETDICMISALKGNGIKELINLISNSHIHKFNKIKIFPRNVEEIIFNLENRLNQTKNKRFYAVEMLINNKTNLKFITNKIENLYKMDITEVIITFRYEFINKICKECITKTNTKTNITLILDKLFLNKYLAIPIFVVIMFLMYFLSIGIVGNLTNEFSKNIFDNINSYTINLLINLGVSDWIVSLICDGIIIGVGSILSFLPQIIMLFTCISILETTGYMSRITFVLDKIFIKLGLSGKVLIPLIIGTGCSVPAIMSTKIMEKEYDRKVSSIITPFIPCSAKLPIIALFTSYFYHDNYAVIATSFYFIAILIIIIISLIIKKISNQKITSTYITELPEYRFPNLKLTFKNVYDRVKEFIKKAGTVIFLSSIITWFLLSFSTKFEYCTNIEKSILAFIGQKLSWFFYPIVGVNSWQVAVSAIQGLIAKEQVVSSLEIISGLSNDAKNISEIFSNGSPFAFFDKASSYAFITFNLFSLPCFAALATLKKELNNTKIFMIMIIFQTLIAWAFSSSIFNILKFFTR